MVKGRRLRRALCNGGWGGVAWSSCGAACGRLCPGSLVAVVVRREPARPGGIKPDHTLLATGLVRPDTARPGWLAEPADSDEESGTTPPVGRIPEPHAHHLTAACTSRSGPLPHHRGVVPDPSSLSAGEAKLAGPGVSSRAFPQASRCDPAGHHRTGLLPSGDDSDEGSGTKATTSNNRHQIARPGLPPVAERPPEALLLI